MRTVAGHIRISDQQAQEIKRHHEQRDADERQIYDELAATYDFKAAREFYDARYGAGAAKRDRAICASAGINPAYLDSIFGPEPNPMPRIAPPGVIAVECRSKSALNKLPHKARIETHNGWWYRYTVHRTCGIGIPENSCSLHRTLKGAERAVRRWKAREYTPTTVTRTYTRDEVQRLVATTRHQSCDEPNAQEWANKMLDEYDAQIAERS